MDSLVSRVVKGYQFVEKIGAGSYGTVFRAYQLAVQRDVAVKVISPEQANQPEFIRRFEAEAQLVASLEHPHIVPLHDYWRDPNGAFLVMRWLPESLRTALSSGPWTVSAAARLLEQIAGALSVAHRHGVIHRDIKPDNILLDEDGNAYLADFGIARAAGVAETLAAPSATLDSAVYLTPEQIKSEAVSPQTDIYGVGLVLYEVLTGERPFKKATSSDDLVACHLREPLPSVRASSPGLPPALDVVIQTATAKAPAHRYPDVMRFAAAFHAAAPGARTPTSQQPLAEPLTERELEILDGLRRGLSNGEIASELFLSLTTIKWYMRQIFSKLDVHDRNQAVERARQLGLLDLVRPAQTAANAAVHTLSVQSVAEPPVEAPHTVKNPYKGLRAFHEADAPDFFGRESLTQHMLDRLAEEHPLGRFLAVVGPSGSGKSSVVRAGLIPALRAGRLPGSEGWYITEMLPGAHPLEEVEIALTRVAARLPPDMLDELRHDERGLLRLARKVLPDADSVLLLLIDQFEEVFTLAESPVEVGHLLDSLYAATCEPRSPLRILVTLRADFFDRPLWHAGFARLLDERTQILGPLRAEEVERAIVGPAGRAGATLEDGLVAAIVADANEQPGALPLLQYALTELFERRDRQRLTLDAYRAIGGLSGALARRAESLFSTLGEREQGMARQLFLRLVTLGEGVEDTRRRTLQSELLALGDPDATQTVLDAFDRARLLSFDRDPQTHVPTVEVAHEAILHEWTRLRGWLDESRADVRNQRLLASAAMEWTSAGRDPSYLLRGSRLSQMAAWAQSAGVALTGDEREYLSASLQSDERSAALRRRARRAVAGTSLVVALIMALLALLATSREQQAQEARATSDQNARRAAETADEARTLALINGARAALAGGDTETALALAVALNQHANARPDFQVVLSDAAYAPGTVRLLSYTTYPDTFAISPDGRSALVGYGDGAILLWDLDRTSPTFGQTLLRLEGHTVDVTGVAFTPDGKRAFSSENSHLALLWDLDRDSPTFGQAIQRFEGHTRVIKNSILSPDGRMGITAACQIYDGSISACTQSDMILWDVDPSSPTFGQSLAHLEGHTGLIQAIAFSPDGRRVLSSCLYGDRHVLLWDVDPASPTFGQQLHSYEAPVEWISSVAFRPHSGDFLVGTYGDDRQFFLYDSDSGERIRSFSASTWAVAAAFSPDGLRLLTGMSDGTMLLWNVETGQQIAALHGHTMAVSNVAFTPDGRFALSVSYDGVRLWDLESGTRMRQITPALSPSGSLAFVQPSMDGRVVFVGDRLSGAVIGYGTGAGREQVRLTGQDVAVPVLSLSPDGRRALTVDVKTAAKLWDVRTGQLLGVLRGHSGVRSIGFAPDGRTAVGTDGYSVLVWDIDPASLTFEQPVHRFVPPLPVPVGQHVPLWLALSPDGRQVVVLAQGGDIGTALLMDLDNGWVLQRFEHDSPPDRAAFSPDGRYVLVFTMDGSLQLWDCSTGQPIRRFVGTGAGLYDLGWDLTISPDGRTALTTSAEGVVLWDIGSGRPIRYYREAQGLMRWSPDGHSFWSTADMRRIVEYRVDSADELMAWTLANRYVRDLTCEERSLYQIEPLCSTEGGLPTPAAILTPIPSAAEGPAMPTPSAMPIGFGPAATITPTVTLMPVLEAHAGEQRGSVTRDAPQIWRYEGRAGEALTIRVLADHPARPDARPEDALTPEGGLLDTLAWLIGPDGSPLIFMPSVCCPDAVPGSDTNALIPSVRLPEDGVYEVFVSSQRYQSEGAYTLVIESQPPGAPTASAP